MVTSGVAIGERVWLHGAMRSREEAHISPFDGGFLYADGLFETIAVEAGSPLFLDAHLTRMSASAEGFGLALPPLATLSGIVAAVIAENAGCQVAGEGVVRLTVSRGSILAHDTPVGQSPTVFAYMRSLSAAHRMRRAYGVAGWRSPYAAGGTVASHKTLAYLSSLAALRWLRGQTDDPIAEPLLVDAWGGVLEGATCNVFAVVDGALVTPSVQRGVLAGTARAFVLEAWRAAGGREPLDETLTPSLIATASEAFVTSSTLRVAPLIALDGDPIGAGTPGPHTTRLRKSFEAAVFAQLSA